MAKQKVSSPDIQEKQKAEEKILEAARRQFSKLGFAGTRTRDIAEEAGINLALLNYYFRSKEKLFEVVMMESMQKMVGNLALIVNDKSLSLEDKLQKLAESYYVTISQNPHLPLFVLSELQKNPVKMEGHLGIRKIITESHLLKQLQKAAPKKIRPINYVFNIMGLSVFPFMAAPMLKMIGDFSDEEYLKLLQERIKLIPGWIMSQLEINSK